MFKPCPSFSQTISKYQTHISFKRNNANRCLDGKKKKNKPETNSIGFASLIGNQDLGCSGSRGNLVELAYRANRKGECANPTTRLGQLNASVFWSMPLASQLARHHLSLSLFLPLSIHLSSSSNHVGWVLGHARRDSWPILEIDPLRCPSSHHLILSPPSFRPMNLPRIDSSRVVRVLFGFAPCEIDEDARV